MRARMRAGLARVVVSLIGAVGSLAAERPAQAPDLTPIVLKELAPHPPVVLVDNGKPVGSIAVIHSTKDPHFKQALNERSAVIGAATGVKLPVGSFINGDNGDWNRLLSLSLSSGRTTDRGGNVAGKVTEVCRAPMEELVPRGPGGMATRTS